VRRRTLLAAAAAWLTGCATPPPPPPKRGRLTGADIYALDPAVLRAAVLTDERVIIPGVLIELRAVAHEGQYLIRLQRRAPADARLPRAPRGQAWQVFALNADSASTLDTVRQMLMSRGVEADAVRGTVSAPPGLVPADLLGAVPLRIDLLVDNRTGWFTLVESTLDLRP
jgi:hypothetical protein